MFTLISFFKKIILAVLVLAVGLAALPAVSAFAAELDNQTALPGEAIDSNHLEHAWSHAQIVYLRQGNRIAKSDVFIARVQSLIDKAAIKGWDTSAVQAALDTFSAVIPAAQAAHQPGAAIISSHNGFDATGKVTERAAAIETVKALSQVLKDTRTAMNGTGKALREAIKAFREAHKPTP